jgi:hypothetical protein
MENKMYRGSSMKITKTVICASIMLMTVVLAACTSPTIPPVPTAEAPTSTAITISPPPATTSPTTVPTSTAASAFTNPFAYCSAVVNIDQPDARFSGPKIPDVIANGVKKASGASADAPIELFRQNSFWRCMDGKVYACTVGANLPCWSKANTEKTPSSAETDYCKANPDQDIPAYVTGHDTIYTWHCNQQTATVQKQVFTVDARGFITEIWYQINPQ